MTASARAELAPHRGYLLAAVAALLWSTMGLFGKGLFEYGAAPLTVVALRATVVFLTLALFAGLRGWPHLPRGDYFFFAIYGLVGVAAPYFLFFTAVQLVGVALTTILLYTYPAFVTLLSRVLLRERITRWKAMALLSSLIGVALVAGIGTTVGVRADPRGVAAALLAGLSASVYSIFGKKAVERHSPQTVMLYSCGFGSLFLLAAQFLTLGYPELARPAAFWCMLMALAWVSTLAGSLAYIAALARIEASRASIMATIEPVAASALAYVFFHEALSARQILGMALVVGGVIIVRRGQ
ncbi:MAG: DMT family transporter [Acidobacteriota bacterium]